MKTIIIQASSRSQGDTYQLVQALKEKCSVEVIDLYGKNIHAYDYEYRHMDDDYIPIIEKMLKYDTIIFATPVYWYSMSGLLKNFFDRITDLLKPRKDLGYQLKGKRMLVLSCSSDDELVPEFIAPFKYSAEYLGMTFKGHVHGWLEDGKIPDEVKERLAGFATRIKALSQ